MTETLDSCDMVTIVSDRVTNMSDTLLSQRRKITTSSDLEPCHLILSLYNRILIFVGVIGSLGTDDLPNPLELRRAFWTRYGAYRFRCNSTIPFPKNALPSILNLFEMNVVGNVMFRLCSCLPIAVRLFVVYCRR
ncbi:hypothetical protein Y032_0398g737 [Ancylostoma ceylanicum]|uniref:Uncharacterized protein n=3 Tax=Ancylostoma ceylanicum TaxID=53326 RepID=A0A016RRC8_9BILA|nr:hypothetical protein Y032_0398g737 [Ancylostoma ceylanicum]